MAHLSFFRLLSLAFRQLLRDARAGELRVLFFALVIAVTASTAIGYFGARLNGAMLLRATEFLGPTWCCKAAHRRVQRKSTPVSTKGSNMPVSLSFPVLSLPTAVSSSPASRPWTTTTRYAANCAARQSPMPQKHPAQVRHRGGLG